MPWSETEEDLLRQWITEATYQHKMHNHAAVYYTRMYYLGATVAVFLGLFTTTSIYVQFALQFGHTVWGMVAVGFLALITTLATAVLQVYNPSQLANDHMKAVNLYYSFFQEARRVIGQPPSQRGSCSSYLKRARVELTVLVKACPVIPNHISQLYVNKLRHKLPALQELVVGEAELEEGRSTRRELTADERYILEKSSIVSTTVV